jgi:hypothetical protein
MTTPSDWDRQLNQEYEVFLEDQYIVDLSTARDYETRAKIEDHLDAIKALSTGAVREAVTDERLNWVTSNDLDNSRNALNLGRFSAGREAFRQLIFTLTRDDPVPGMIHRPEAFYAPGLAAYAMKVRQRHLPQPGILSRNAQIVIEQDLKGKDLLPADWPAQHPPTS